MTEFLKSKFNVTYSTGQASSVLGEVGGTMLDWVYEDLGADRAYALELVRLVAQQEIFSQVFSGCQGDETPLCLFQCPVKVARCLSQRFSNVNRRLFREVVLPPVWAALKLLVKEAWRRDFSPPSHNNQSLQQKR